MTKSYKELLDMGWTVPTGNFKVFLHPVGSLWVFREDGESDEDFRERLHRSTPLAPKSTPTTEPVPVPEPVYVPNDVQLYWFNKLKEIERRSRAGEVDQAALVESKIEAQLQFRNASLWDLRLYTHLNSLGHTKLTAVPWGIVQAYVDDPKYLITAQNWSGDGVWKVFFYHGTKRKPHQDCVGTAVRVGWLAMELIKS